MTSGPADAPPNNAVAAREAWFHERQSAWLYRRLAAVEPDPPKRHLFEALATAAEEQAGTWARHLVAVPPFAPSLRARLVANLTDRLGPRRMSGALIALKMRGLSVYNPPTVSGHAMPTTVETSGCQMMLPALSFMYSKVKMANNTILIAAEV